jgi:glycosyltransferase involved in cell wall biosynthesis
MVEVLRRRTAERTSEVRADAIHCLLAPERTGAWLPALRGRSVCLYTPSADPSGMGAHMLDLGEQMARAGAQVTVMCWPTAPGRRLLERAEAFGARPIALPHPRDRAFAPAIRAFLSAHQVDVFHLHVGTGRENFDGARAARAAGVPVVLQTQHLPWLLSSPRKREPFFAGIEDVDRILTVSQGQRQTYERIGVPGDRMSTVANGVRPRGAGPGRAEARRRLGLSAEHRIVLSVGRLIVMKGQRHLIEAVPQLVAGFPDLRVVLIGDGHLREQLAAQAGALGVSGAVLFAGHRADARELLDAADVFVLPSRHEGMPLAAMEAMDAGLPVVGTRVIGTAEVVVDGVTGSLVAPGDCDQLGLALDALLADPALRARFGEAGRRRYLDLFTSERMAEDTARVYLEALQTAARRSGR